MIVIITVTINGQSIGHDDHDVLTPHDFYQDWKHCSPKLCPSECFLIIIIIISIIIKIIIIIIVIIIIVIIIIISG